MCLEQLSRQICIYLVADDPGHLRRCGLQKGDRSGFVDRVKGMTLGLGSLLDVKPVFGLTDGEDKPVALSPSFEEPAEKLFGYTLAWVQVGELLALQLGLSYIDSLTALRDLPGFTALESACRKCNTHLRLGTLSPIGGVSLGAGATSLGFTVALKAFV